MALYNQALTPEMRRITDKARGRWGKDYDYLEVINCDNDDCSGKEQMVNMSKVVNYSHKFSSTSVNSSVKASSSSRADCHAA